MRLFCVFATLFFATVVSAETRAAFIVGNSEYENATRLANPVRDARLVGDTLTKLGFDVTRHQDLTRESFAKAFGAFLKKSRDADVTFFYFAGHGMQYDGQNYLVGTDAELISELDIEGETIALNKVVELLERNSKAALVFVDACRDNPLATDFYRRNYSETRALTTRGLARVRSRIDGSMLVFAAAPGQLAYDGDGKNSPFATALARHLPTENIEILTLTKRIIGDVRDATDGRQSPIVTNDLTTEIFLKLTLEISVAQPQGDEEQSLYLEAKTKNSVDSWDDYLESFPNGQFAREALTERQRLLSRQIALQSGYPEASSVTRILNVPIEGKLLRWDYFFEFTTQCENDHFAKIVSPRGKTLGVMDQGWNRCLGKQTRYSSYNTQPIGFVGTEVNGNWVFSMKDGFANEYSGTLDDVRITFYIDQAGETVEYTVLAEDLPQAIPNPK